MKKRICSVLKNLTLRKGGIEDYKSLSWCHYLGDAIGPYSAIYALESKNDELAGVIVYSLPSRGLELRNIATGNFFSGLPRVEQLILLNKYFRRISRVIIEPRYRGLGLAAELVRLTMPLPEVPFIEALAVMGHVNDFFARAGMTGFIAPVKVNCARLLEALSTVGIESDIFFDAELVQKKIDTLDTTQSDFIDEEIKRFLRPYPKRRYTPNGIERTQFVLNKLNARAVYYIKKIEEKNVQRENETDKYKVAAGESLQTQQDEQEQIQSAC